MPQKTAATSPRVKELIERLERSPAPRVFMELAKEHQAAGDLEEAARVCRQALERHPSYHSARVLLARILIDLGRFAEAVPELESVVRQAPDNLLARRLLGEARVGSGDRDGGLETLRELRLLNPDDSDLASRIRGLESPEEAIAPPAETVERPEEEVAAPAEAVEAPPAGEPEEVVAGAAEPEFAEAPAVEEPEAVAPAVALEPPAEELAEGAGKPVSPDVVAEREKEVTAPAEAVEAPPAGEPEEVVAGAAEPEFAEAPAVEEPEAVAPAVALEPPAEELAEEIGRPVSPDVVAERDEEVTAPAEAVEAPPAGEPEEVVAEAVELAPDFKTVALSPEFLAAESLRGEEPRRAEPRAEAEAPGEEPPRRAGGIAGALATPTLAEIYYQQGLPEKAVETYEQVLAGDPDNEEVRSRLRQIRSELPRAASTARRKIRALETWVGRIRRSRNAQDRA